jgi:prepilin-type N-terminal cleavage/methylation domain-containing protein/prepilin-type processing-associated H-X9-DG protein
MTTRRRQPGFTLVELLVVIGIMSLLVGIVLPSLDSARQIARRVYCQTNLRVLAIANNVYASENNGLYAPGAANFIKNKDRWFGRRKGPTGPFEEGGPLTPYFETPKVRRCPSFRDCLVGFEAGCGGYGYNNNFVGQLRRAPGYQLKTDRSGNRSEAFADTSATVAFTDSAMVDAGLIEYSFAESPRWPDFDGKPWPSIHFRHAKLANVAWLDGHVSSEAMTFSTDQVGYYEGRPIDYLVGWFGPDDNSYFDCQ